MKVCSFFHANNITVFFPVAEPDASSNGDTTLKTSKGQDIDVQSQLDKEEQDLERAMSSITEEQVGEKIQFIMTFFELHLRRNPDCQCNFSDEGDSR